MKEIRDWLKSMEAKNFERVPLDAEQLDSDIVHLIEEDADASNAQQPPMHPKKVRGVPRSALLRPADVEHRLGNQTFKLGDRVVYAQDSGKVPIATRGTVVGLTRTPRTVLLDVVFDVSFMSGTTLGGRCSPFRGQTVLASSVLNVSYRQLLASSRAAASQQTQQEQTPLTLAGYGAPLGPNGQGQLQNAPAPPPLRGSFRGAVSGQGAGRGGRGGYANGQPTELPFRPNGNGGALVDLAAVDVAVSVAVMFRSRMVTPVRASSRITRTSALKAIPQSRLPRDLSVDEDVVVAAEMEMDSVAVDVADSVAVPPL
ncbi:hypothetical protein N7526_005886 [Penicillium atrosanguineum]|nr:hypothetical protein N7526_005886 [Penicillium atrosanguineum]